MFYIELNWTDVLKITLRAKKLMLKMYTPLYAIN